MKADWSARLSAPGRIVVKPAPVAIAGMRRGERMLVPTPRLIDDFIKALPMGTGIDIRRLRQALAAAHDAEVTCPITTGYHIRTVAEAAFEAYSRGEPIDSITPFWRVLDAKAPTTARLACGVDFVVEQRAREGLPAFADRTSAS